MKIRVFKKQDGSVIYNFLNPKFENGDLIDDLTKPIYSDIDDLAFPITEEVEDKERPILEEVKSQDENGQEVILHQISGYQKKTIVIGYNKKTVLVGYEKRSLTLEDCPIPKDCEGLDFITLDDSEIHPSDSTIGDYHEMIHFDGECKKENLKQDKSWEVRLMPEFLIKEKHHARLDSKIDAELEKESPDVIALMKLQREKDTSKKWDEKKWYEQALKNLDERVAGGEADKIKIRSAIDKKIEAITKAEQALAEEEL